MGTVKKGSYPSRQIRAGPAPLASFEDLPSDEMDSPDNGKIEDSGDTGSVKLVGVDGYTIGDCETPTPGTLTPNGLDSPQDIDGFVRDTVTPTPSHPMTPQETEPTGTELCGDSGDAPPDAREKSKWAETACHNRDHPQFGDRNRKLLSPSSPLLDAQYKGHEDSEYLDDEASRKRREKKGFFTSIFKISGRKSPGKELISPVKHGGHVETLPGVVDGKIPSQISEVSKSQTPAKDKDPSWTEKSDSLVERSASRGSGLHLPLHDAAHGDVPEKHCTKNVEPQSSNMEYLLTVKHAHRVKKSESDAGSDAPRRDIQDSSGSELEFDPKAITESLKKTDSDDDFEAATLLVQDSLEYEEASITELAPPLPPPPPVDSSKSLVKTPTRRQRLEVITIPIERPRSTTPINIAPLEAFLQTASPSSDYGGEKIKLSLPGEKFSSRPRSPRKGNPKSWFDFCEEGLQSPRSHRRQSAAKAGFQALDDSTPLSDGGDKTFPSTPDTDAFLQETNHKQQWTTFGSFSDEPELIQKVHESTISGETTTSPDQIKFSDKFSDFVNSDVFSSLQNATETDLQHPNNCSCECHSCTCDCHYELSVESEKTTQDFNKPWKHLNDANTCPCDCHCHDVSASGLSKDELHWSSSDISTSSRRCSVGSSPSHCSSPDEKGLDSPEKNFSN